MIAGNLIEIIRLPKIPSRKCLRKSNLWRYSRLNYTTIMTLQQIRTTYLVTICYWQGFNILLLSLCYSTCFLFNGVYRSGASWVLFGTPRPPSLHDPLHFSPFYHKGLWTAATGKSNETSGCPGYNDKSKDQLRAHERLGMPPQDLLLQISLGQRFQEASDQ